MSLFADRVKLGFEQDRGKPLVKAEILDCCEPGRPTFARTYSYSVINFAMRVFWLEEEEYYDAANEALQENCNVYINNKPCRDDRDSFYWSIDIFCRLIEYFGQNGCVNAGLIRKETEALFLDMAFLWCQNNSKSSRAEWHNSKTWNVWESENHHVQGFTTCWHLSKFLMNSEKYKNVSYDDGYLPGEHYRMWNEYIKEWCRQRGKKSLFVEVGNGDYGTETLKGIYNVFDFTEDKVTKALTQALLDLYWAAWSEEQLYGVRGGGKTRVYPDWRIKGKDGLKNWCWYYLDLGEMGSIHANDYTIMTSRYRLPAIISKLALSVEERGIYEITQRPLGLAEDGYYINPDYHLAKDWGGIIKYSFATPQFIIGSLMFEPRPLEDWTLISSQNRFQGVIFSSHEDARTVPVPECKASDATPIMRSYNQHYSVQKKGALITQKITQHSDAGAMQIWLSDAGGLSNYTVNKNWIFTKTDGCYVAICIVNGGYFVDKCEKGCYINCEEEWTPVIMEVVPDSVGTESEYQEKILKKNYSYADSKLTYQSTYGDVLEFWSDYSQMPQINGVSALVLPAKAFDSPYIQGDWDDGLITITFGGETLTLDFRI